MKDQTMSPSSANGSLAPTSLEIVTVATRACPVIDTINVDRSTDVHIGPKIVSVIQNIDNVEKVKGRFLGLELVSDLNRSRRLRCPVVVSLCWAMIICLALFVYLLYTLLNVRPTRLDIGINETWYMRRAEWQAIQPVGIDFLKLPVSYIIIGHSASGYCNERYECAARALAMQKDHIFRAFYDIGPNFLVGGNGYILEGRGANVFGAMLTRWNYKSVGIMFLGNYGEHMDEVDDAQINNVNILLGRLVELNVLTSNYELYADCQITQSRSPGQNVLDRLHEFSHWNPVNVSTCLRERNKIG